MEVSKFLLHTTSLTLDALFKASDADIRLHNHENLPKDQPLLFVVNHFTRLETTFLPYMIYKILGRYSLSMAHHSFFGGKFGKILEKIGAISTKHPDRNKIFLKNLLTGEYYNIIFPEGQMVKDKKLIEKGKFMIYNTGIRRPPHTGAARLAMRAQFYREKLKYFKEMGYKEEIIKYSEYFGLKEDEIDDIISKETFIVPVNITYYPIRAKNNSIKQLVERFAKNISERLEEELEVEGTMLMEGVDIDINFGKPISIKHYIEKDKIASNQIRNSRLILEHEERRKLTPMRKVGIELMKEYMTGIYEMTTVNHDHIFSYFLTMYPKNKIDENDFKNRGNLAMEKIKELNLTNYHTTLNKKNTSLQTDDFNFKYNNFIDAALSDNLISIKNGWIIRNKNKFSSPYQFHSVRKDNIVEVLKNEIEPLKALMRILRNIMFHPPTMIRYQVKNKFLKIDSVLFQNDYKKYFIEGESKPQEIGQPFFLKKLFQRKGVIIVHGYMAAPEEIRPLADFLHKKGYAVYGARLRGHGTAPEDLASRQWEEWYDSVNRAYVIMKNSVKDFSIVGFSTGGGLALMQAALKGKKLKSVVSINAPLKLQNITSKFSSAIVLWNNLLNKFDINNAKVEYVKNTPENAHINYLRNPVSGVNQLGILMENVESKLENINIPTLIVQGNNDPVVNPISAKEIMNQLGTDNKELFEVESDRHGIVRGDVAEQVLMKTYEFIKKTLG